MMVVYMNRRDTETDGLTCTNSTISICRTCLIVVACALRMLRVRGDKITIHREFTSIRPAQRERLRALLMKAKP